VLYSQPMKMPRVPPVSVAAELYASPEVMSVPSEVNFTGSPKYIEVAYADAIGIMRVEPANCRPPIRLVGSRPLGPFTVG
jgi:hypothetical protein